MDLRSKLRVGGNFVTFLYSIRIDKRVVYWYKGTYKLGMNNKIQINDFVDLLDEKKECRYIKE